MEEKDIKYISAIRSHRIISQDQHNNSNCLPLEKQAFTWEFHNMKRKKNRKLAILWKCDQSLQLLIEGKEIFLNINLAHFPTRHIQEVSSFCA